VSTLSAWIFVLEVFAVLGLFWLVLGWVLDRVGGCLCVKNGWHPDCPVHGRER